MQVLARLRGQHHLEWVDVDDQLSSPGTKDWEVPITGTVVGTILNDEESLLAHADEFDQAPYRAAPRAPVLYLKPSNTWTAHLHPIAVPTELDGLEVGASIGIVFAETATRVSQEEAMRRIAGYVVVNDLCEVHGSLYRPAIRERCRDGFCAIGPWITPRGVVRSPDALVLRTFVNDKLRAETTTASLIRKSAELIADITEFMTLAAGDVLLLGPGADRPVARPGDRIRIEVAGVGTLENDLIRAGSAVRVSL